jgi:putative transposase
LRAIFDAILYVLHTGCPWRYLPANFPPWQTVFYHFRRLRLKGTWFRLLTALREAERKRVGRNAQPSAAIIDAQSVKTVEESAGISGFDAHKHVKGRKRHILVDTLGLLLSVYVTPADLHDSKGARCLLAGLAPVLPRLKKIWADAAYRGQELAAWCQAEGGWDLEVVERTPGTRGFSVLPRRWVVERTFSWISRNRRMSKDYERKVQTSETLIQLAMIRLLLARLVRHLRTSSQTPIILYLG